MFSANRETVAFSPAWGRGCRALSRVISNRSEEIVEGMGASLMTKHKVLVSRT